MTVSRSQLVDLEVTPYYHCISRCVRRAHLCGEGYEHRKDWIEKRLEELAGIFAVSVAGYAILDSHLHIVVRLDGQRRIAEWSAREVVQRWGQLFPPRDKKRRPLPVTETWIQQKLSDQQWLQRTRQRLASLGWFMKCLKEPLARLANREDGCRGAFFEGRYKSIAILDNEALLATCAYVDLNPLAAGIADLPETSEHTSVMARVDHCRDQGRRSELKEALQSIGDGRTLTTGQASRLEEKLWLCPFAQEAHSTQATSGMLEHFSLAHYLQLLDWTSRMVRGGKQRVSRGTAALLERLGTRADVWQATLEKMFSRNRILGVAFSFSRERLRQAAAHRGCHHLANLNGCPA